MKKNLTYLLLGSGWLFLAIFLLSGYFFNKLSDGNETSNFRPIVWGYHMELFKGAVQCSLLEDDILERKIFLKKKVFSKVTRKEEKIDGSIYFFEDEITLLSDAIEFVQKEKECCPFFKFDISILPFGQGFAIQISGSEDAIEMLRDFENNEY